MDAFRVEGVGQLLAEGVYFLNCASLHTPGTVEIDLFPAQAVARKMEKDAMKQMGGDAKDSGTASSNKKQDLQLRLK